MKKKTALKDIAKKVGVSTTLVSFVLNNLEEEKRVGKEIAKKIRAAAIKLNYTPNQIARSLKTKKTNTIGFVVADIDYRYSSRVMKTIEAECKKLHMTVIYGSSGENAKKFSELINILVDRQVDGLILIPVENCRKEIEYLTEQQVPFVLIDRMLSGIKTNVIGINNEKASFRATQHLIDTGHRRIALITYKSKLLNLSDRKKGYQRALKEAGLNADPLLIREITDRQDNREINAFIDELLKLTEPCDSILFATDTLAIDGLRHINKRQIEVPRQLGIVSFDESESFELFHCPITYGKQPLEAIGQAAVQALMAAIRDPGSRTELLLETDFHIGKSCGES